jgi:hypothetical protein
LTSLIVDFWYFQARIFPWISIKSS